MHEIEKQSHLLGNLNNSWALESDWNGILKKRKWIFYLL